MIDLLQLGIPWEVLNEMEEQEITTLVAFNMARQERQTEALAEKEATVMSQYRSNR